MSTQARTVTLLPDMGPGSLPKSWETAMTPQFSPQQVPSSKWTWKSPLGSITSASPQSHPSPLLWTPAATWKASLLPHSSQRELLTRKIGSRSSLVLIMFRASHHSQTKTCSPSYLPRPCSRPACTCHPSLLCSRHGPSPPRRALALPCGNA